MAITRRIVAHHENEDNQWLKVDHSSRFIVNEVSEWQFLFSPNSSLSNGSQVLQLAAEFDTTNFSKIRMVGYLYNPTTSSVDNAGSVVFNVYRVADSSPLKWDDVLITSLVGVQQSNNYFFKDTDISLLTGTNLDGDTTIMIEGIATRLGLTYRSRVYINHLGVYDSIIRLRRDVEFLDITKQDE